ncbi:hypothetical protein C8Q79DRAFT_196207 [Trametes meyenii]|nr:hypothetical protein C8Q79DRAFT_196207 [Trametes meyenii]
MSTTTATRVFANRCSICTMPCTDIIQHTQSAHAMYCTEQARRWKCANAGCEFTFFEPFTIGLHYLKFHTTLTPFVCNHAFIDKTGSKSQCNFASADLAEFYTHREKHAQAAHHPRPRSLCHECDQPVPFPEHLCKLFSSWVAPRGGSLNRVKFTECEMPTVGDGPAAVQAAANAISVAYSGSGTWPGQPGETLSAYLIVHPSITPWYAKESEDATIVRPVPTISASREAARPSSYVLRKFILTQIQRAAPGHTQTQLPRLPELDVPLPASRTLSSGQIQYHKQRHIENGSALLAEGAAAGGRAGTSGREVTEPNYRLVPLPELQNAALQRYGYVPGRRAMGSNGNRPVLPTPEVHGPPGPLPHAR